MMNRSQHSRGTAVKRSTTRKKTAAQKPVSEKIEDVKKLVQLLQISQIELEHQNEELRLTEEELEASRNKYVNFFDFSPIPYFGLDRNGTIREVNLIAGKMIGVDRSKLIGRQFITFVVREDKNIFSVFMKELFSSASMRSCKLNVANKDKRMFYVLLEGIRWDDSVESGEQCQIALIDLTEYRKTEVSLEKMSEELKALKAGK
jgi:PAS domain S-box-containing protein